MANTDLNVPTLAELVTRIRADLDAQLPGEGAKVRRTFLYVLGGVMGGAIYSLYRLAVRISKNIVIDRIEDESILVRIAAVWGVYKDPGTAATQTLQLSGTNGITIPAGTEIERANGFTYTTDADGTISGGTVDVEATATAPAADGNITDATEELTLSSAIAGVSSTVTVVAPLHTDGTDAESIASLRGRLIDRLRDTPQGGAGADYAAWVREAPGISADVTRVWVSQEGDPPAVSVWFTVEGSGSGVIPSGSDETAAQAYIDETDTDGHSIRRPVTADVTVAAPNAYTVDFSIGISPNNATVRAQVQAELESLFLQEADVRTSNDTVTIRNAKIHEAISRAMAKDLDFYTLDGVAGGAGSDNIQPPAVGDLPILGTVTWATL